MKTSIIFIIITCFLCSKVESADFYVATNGSDSASGDIATPFATLECARDAMRQAIASNSLSMVNTVYLREGVYERTNTFELNSQDSAPDGSLIAYRSYPGETARISGGRQLDGMLFSVVSSNATVWSRIDPAAQGNLLQTDMTAQGVTNLGTLVRRGWNNSGNPSAAELYFDGEPMQLGRWPNGTGFSEVASRVNDTTFTYSDTRPERWSNAEEVWLHGLWYNFWADSGLKALSINTSTKQIVLSEAPNYGIAASQPFFAYNLLEEIDTSGEYYIDRTTGMLYFWPPTNNVSTSDIMVSTLSSTVAELSDVKNVVLHDLEIVGSRNSAITLAECTDVIISQCLLKNCGLRGLSITSCVRSGAERCEIMHIGGAACSISSGDRNTLTPSGSFIRNCDISNFGRRHMMYNPGVRISGVGGIIEHNLIHNAPHSAIIFGGNNNTIAYNKIYDVCYWAADAAAIYAGRSWVNRGNHLTYNFIHDITTVFSSHHSVSGIYCDDCLAGNYMHGNTLYNVSGNALFNAGGRDNTWENNVVAKCGYAHRTDVRGVNQMTENGDSWDLLYGARKYNYKYPPWSDAYPRLAAIPDDHALLTPYKKPGGTVFSRNIGWQNTTWLGESDSATSYYKDFSDNLSNSDPKFVDEATLNLKLRPDSPAYTLPGFKEIPFEDIGIEPLSSSTYNLIGFPSFTTNSATILGYADCGSEPWCVATFFWDSQDQGANDALWANSTSLLVSASGPVRITVPLAGDGNYVGRMQLVSDHGTFWSPALTPEPFPGSWNTETYSKKMEIEFAGYTESPLTNFPALVVLSTNLAGFSYTNFSYWNGADLRFTDEHRNTLSHEIEHWNFSGESYVWVRVPLLTSSTKITAFWGEGTNSLVTPANIQGLKLWLEADIGVITNSTGVTHWMDQSGNGNDAIQTNASLQAQYIAQVDALNDKPTLRFVDTANDGVGFDAVNLDIADGQNRTVFLVATPESGHQNSEIIGRGTTQMLDAGNYSTDNRLRIRNDTTHLYCAENSLMYDKPHIIAVSSDTAATRITVRVDGIILPSCSNVTSTAFNWNMNVLRIGISNTENRSYKGDISEVLVFDRALTDAEIDLVTVYLEVKYRLSSTFDSLLPHYTTDGTTWSEGYAGVWHMDGKNSVNIDSTSRTNHAIPGAGTTMTPSGKIGHASRLGGQNNPGVCALPAYSAYMDTSEFTISAWVKSEEYDTAYGGGLNPNGYIFSTRGSNPESGYGIYLSNVDGNHQAGIMNRSVAQNALTSNQVWTAGEWSHLTVTHDSGAAEQKIFVNGNLVGTGANSWLPEPTDIALIGCESHTKYYYNGILDELRLSEQVRSANWIRACWLNSASNGIFSTYSAINPVRIDTDADGIMDEWEYRYSGSATGIVATADQDGDNIINSVEFVMDTPPSQSNAVFNVRSISSETDNISLTFGPTTDRREYEAEYRTNLLIGIWQPLNDSIAGSNGVMMIEDNTNDPTRYYRIKVRLP